MRLSVFLLGVLLAPLIVSAFEQQADPELDDSRLNAFLAKNRNTYVMGRLELYSPEETQPRCIQLDGDYSPSSPERPRILQTTCLYTLRFMFLYDASSNVLRSALYPDLQLAADQKDRRILEATYGLKFMTAADLAMKQQDEPMTASFATLIPRTFSVLSLSNPVHPRADGLCLRTSGGDRSTLVVAAPVSQGDDSQCSLVRLVPNLDDYSVGTLIYKRAGQKFCVTYTQNVLPPRSVLYLDTCRVDKKNQEFLYNDINGQVRAKLEPTLTSLYDNPVLFMWWSGGMKPYFEVPFTGDEYNYGWSLPQPHIFGPILSRDTRGYSGNCWMVAKNRDIVANQTCSRFSFQPTKLSSTLALQAALRKYFNVATVVQVRRQVNGKPKIECLHMLRLFRKIGLAKVSVMKLQLRDCSVASTFQRFVVVSNDHNCVNSKTCKAHVRWAGDPANSLMWLIEKATQANATGLISYIVQPQSRLEDDINGQWVLPMREFGTVTSTMPGGAGGCWGWKKDSIAWVKSDCIDIRVVPVQDLYDVPQDLVVVQEYRGANTYSMTLDWAVDNGMKMPIGGAAEKANNFFLDSGYFGMRRLTRPVTGDFVTQGDLFVTQYHSLYFPFKPNPHLDTSDTGLVVVRFSAPRVLKVEAAVGRSYLLFSFQDRQGCLMYLTAQGQLGLRCRTVRGDERCQFRFNDGFTLTTGSLHTVGLLYSQDGKVPHSVYVDRTLVGQCNMAEWSLDEASDRLKVFYDRANWQYAPYAGRVSRVSVYAGSTKTLQGVATGKIVAYPVQSRLHDRKAAHPDPRMDTLGYGHAQEMELFREAAETKAPTAAPTTAATAAPATAAPTANTLFNTYGRPVLIEQNSKQRRLRRVIQQEEAEEEATTAPTTVPVVEVTEEDDVDGLAEKYKKQVNDMKPEFVHAKAAAAFAALGDTLRRERARMKEFNDRLAKFGSKASNDDVQNEAPRNVKAQQINALQTEWFNCTAVTRHINAHPVPYAIRCELRVTAPVPRDIFSLGCSRPRCDIFFLPSQPAVGTRFVFQYQPNYPADFVSEDVGSPSLFPDLAMVTDGFQTGQMAFSIEYTPKAVQSTAAPAQSKIELDTERVDTLRYQMKQSCCTRVVPFMALSDDEFFV